MHQPPVNKEIKRRPPPRNHCRPVLRGAPFVICSNCVRLVQLPTDFAAPSRATRRLECGSCSEVLSYSYRDPSRKKPQSPFGGDGYSTGQSAPTHGAHPPHFTSPRAAAAADARAATIASARTGATGGLLPMVDREARRELLERCG